MGAHYTNIYLIKNMAKTSESAFEKLLIHENRKSSINFLNLSSVYEFPMGAEKAYWLRYFATMGFLRLVPSLLLNLALSLILNLTQSLVLILALSLILRLGLSRKEGR